MMNELFTSNQIRDYIVIVILVIIALTFVFRDTSNVQSTHEIVISAEPCQLVGSTQVETSQFEAGTTPFICGEVLSTYLPLELDYYLINSINNDVILSEYMKIETHKFTVDLPANLDVGSYEFEIKAGKRKHIVTTNFEIIR